MIPISELPTNELAHHCAEETDKFKRDHDNNPDFCFELFRRALADHDDEALSYIYHIYLPSLYKKIRYKFQTIIEEDIEHFILHGFTKFVRELRSPKYKNLKKNFKTLAAVISYLKTCAFNVIKEHLRKKRVVTVSIEQIIVPKKIFDPIDWGIQLEQIWERICELIPDEKDQFLARCIFVEHLKPSEILEFHSDIFRDTEEIRIASQRIKRILRKDPTLRDLLK